MSEISETEKRRLLRERRQQKFGKGGATSRLAKITGQTENSFLSTESPIDSKSSTPEPSGRNSNEDSTKQMDELLAQIHQQQPKKTDQGGAAKNPELDLFAQLAKMQQGDASAPTATSETPDIFAQLLKSVQMDQQPQQGIESVFGNQPIDAAVLEAHNVAVNKLKAYTIVVKWFFFILPYVYYISHTGREAFQLTTVDFVMNRSNFFTIFTSFEVVTLSVYYQLLMSAEKSHNINTLNSNSKILKLVSMVPPGLVPIPNLRGKISQALQYWDVLSMYLTDMAFAILLTGIFQYYHAM
ncbi:LANO_0B06216g1_1 [Lachancea nothofagi CBS 11611]|uniref:Golgi to ER traffic protein 2 n=1 Tax=Lachancea nothofagi CBS 11611 TaxID=1266666 RepID=A0A1G4IZA7_9SACH|nr:LANO_0B06216g1_1 [Lachancea nothofagi CBS 11611]